MADTDRLVRQLQAELDELRAEVRELRAGARRRPATGGVSSRRQLLSRGALAAGIGAVGGALAARPAAAAGVDPVELGQQNVTSNSTQVTANGSIADALFGEATNNAATSSAWGVRGETDSVNGYGVYGRNRTPNGPTVGVRGVASSPNGVGVEGTVDDSKSTSGRGPVGVHGHVVGVVDANGVLGQVTSQDSEAAGVRGEAVDKGWGVIGVAQKDDDAGGGVLGICGSGGGRAVNAVHQGNGVALDAQSLGGVGAVVGGKLAAMRLGASSGAPTARTDTHTFGELYVDQQTRQLWYCTQSGTPGSWTQLSLPSLRAVTPFRVYDSRFGDGPLQLGSTRIVSVADSIDIETGATLVTGAVPAGASAVTFNLTVFSTVGDGFVAATPGDATSFGTASVNWAGANQVVGNATLVNLDESRQMKIFIGGTPGARVGFTVDVTGFIV